MKKLLNKIKSGFSKIKTAISNAWLKLRLWYCVRWVKKACIKDKRIYYVLLDPVSRYIRIVDGNEYAGMKRQMKKQYHTGLGAYVYAKANPWA